MKIAINARVLNERHGGPARYTLNLIRELTAVDRDNFYEILMYDRGHTCVSRRNCRDHRR